jgi:hypothetical protein
MKLFPVREILKRRADLALIAAFFAFLWLPTADTCLRLDHTPPPEENRAAASFPEFRKNLGAMRGFFGGVEAYFNDHFGFRNLLVFWDCQWKFRAFSLSKTEGVIVGKERWLFYARGLVVEDTLGRKPFSVRELEAWREVLTERRDWLARRGIRYLFVIPPDKHTIYPEHLPAWLAGNSRPPHRLDQFVAYMKVHGDLPILDLRPALLEAKRTAPVYLQTDTHWNVMGAFVAYQGMVRMLEMGGLPVQPIPLSSFSQSTGAGTPGDLAQMLGLQNIIAESNAVVLTPRFPWAFPQRRAEPGMKAKRWRPDTEPVVWENPRGSGALLLFRDSFAALLMPFLAQHFHRVVSVWQYNWDREFIELEKPDVVIDEMLERSLISLNPADLKAAEEKPDAQISSP